MAKIMINKRNEKLYFYLAKKDLEEVIVEVEFDTDEKWGGNIKLANGDSWYVEPKPKKIPGEFEAKKIG